MNDYSKKIQELIEKKSTFQSTLASKHLQMDLLKNDSKEITSQLEKIAKEIKKIERIEKQERIKNNLEHFMLSKNEYYLIKFKDKPQYIIDAICNEFPKEWFGVTFLIKTDDKCMFKFGQVLVSWKNMYSAYNKHIDSVKKTRDISVSKATNGMKMINIYGSTTIEGHPIVFFNQTLVPMKKDPRIIFPGWFADRNVEVFDKLSIDLLSLVDISATCK